MSIQGQDRKDAYEKLELLGSGGSGVVYNARNKETGEFIALKEFGFVSNNEKDYTLSEIALLQACEHENIVSFYECFEDSFCSVYLVMEKLDFSLDHLLRKHPSGIPEVMIGYITYNILRGMRYLHRNHVIHRDIKSSNIMIRTSGDVKIGDLGVSAQLTNEEMVRKSTVGTIYWMAPEILSLQKYGTKVDIWSLGILLIELSEGSLPFCGKNIYQVMSAIVNDSPPTLKDSENWSPEFNEFIGLCLVKDPLSRETSKNLLKHQFIEDSLRSSYREDFVNFVSS